MSARTVVLAGCAAILGVDTLGSLASEASDLRYEALWPASALITGGTAFLAARRTGRVRTGALAGLAVAGTEATLGWAISWAIGPGRPAVADRAPDTVIAIALTVTLGGAVIGLLSGLLARRVSYA